MIQLGDRVKDTITGFEGIAVARVEHLNGCTMFKVQPTKLSKEGKPIEYDWFDEPQLELVEAKKVEKAKPRHGPQTPPPERHP